MSFTLLLILFSAFTSALLDGLNSELNDQDLNMNKTLLSKLKLKKDQTKTIQLYNEKDNSETKVYVSIVVLGEANINAISNDTKILDGKTKKFNDVLPINYIISNNKEKNKYLSINLTSDNDIDIEITNIIQKDLIQYQIISFPENNVSNNFVLFLNDTNNEYNLSIKFKDDIPKKCFSKLLRLPINDPNFILPASKYENANQNCSDYYNFKISDIKEEDKNKKYPAFIFSIEDNNNPYNYDVYIKITNNNTKTDTKEDEAMNIFLYISIGLAGVFAVITFFLIRRKQSIDTKNDDNKEDLYNEENKDE